MINKEEVPDKKETVLRTDQEIIQLAMKTFRTLGEGDANKIVKRELFTKSMIAEGYSRDGEMSAMILDKLRDERLIIHIGPGDYRRP